jgi:predicted solute-binding protein
MDAYAYRKLIFEKIKLRTENEDVFIKDLQTFNILKIEIEKPIVMIIKNLFPSKSI